jgi:hypothetical protein
MVKRIRGVAYSMRVSPQASNRLVDGARGELNALLADVYIFTDHMAGAEAGASPGYGLALVAETTAGRLLSAEAASPAQPQARARPGPGRAPPQPAGSRQQGPGGGRSRGGSARAYRAYGLLLMGLVFTHDWTSGTHCFCFLTWPLLAADRVRRTACGLHALCRARSPERQACAAELGPGAQGRQEAAMPEAVGRRAAHALLEEISRGGVVDSEHQARARPLATARRPPGVLPASPLWLPPSCCTRPGKACRRSPC